jgi:hypothetical protein
MDDQKEYTTEAQIDMVGPCSSQVGENALPKDISIDRVGLTEEDVCAFCEDQFSINIKRLC